MKKIDIEQLLNVIYSATISLIICYVYVYQVYPDFSYSGLRINKNIDAAYLGLVIVTASLPSFLLPICFYLPSSIVIWLSYYLIYLPSINIAYVSGLTTGINNLAMMMTLLISILSIMVVPRLNAYKTIRSELSNRNYSILLLLIGFICYLIIFLFYKPKVSNLTGLTNIVDLYDIRGEFRDVSSSVPNIARYIFAWSSKIFLPLFIVYSLAKRSKTLFLFSIGTGLLIFSTTGLKSVFLGPVIVCLCWVYSSKKELKFVNVNLYLLLFLLLGLVLYLIGMPQLNNIIIRRVMIIPGYLTGAYFDFFNNEGFNYFSYSIMSSFLDYNYSVTPPFVIGEAYFGRIDMSANANFLASVFGDLGVVGCVIFSLLIGYMFGVLDKLATNKECIPEITALILLPAWTLVDTSMLTALLTHGLGIMFILILLMPSGYLKNYEK